MFKLIYPEHFFLFLKASFASSGLFSFLFCLVRLSFFFFFFFFFFLVCFLFCFFTLHFCSAWSVICVDILSLDCCQILFRNNSMIAPSICYFQPLSFFFFFCACFYISKSSLFLLSFIFKTINPFLQNWLNF